MRTSRPWLQLGRSTLLLISTMMAFLALRYPEGIPICRRRVTLTMRRTVLAAYGVPWKRRVRKRTARPASTSRSPRIPCATRSPPIC